MKKIIKTLVVMVVNLAVIYLSVHATELFLHYLRHHVEVNFSSNTFLTLNIETTHLFIELVPLPKELSKPVEKWLKRYCKTIPKLFILASLFCNILCGNYFNILVDLCWYVADLTVEWIEHHLEFLFNLLNL